MESRDKVQGYWTSPPRTNDPIRYAGGINQGRRSHFLVQMMNNYAKRNYSIMELGCNVGRNLWYLYNAKYQDLSGVEINPKAFEILKLTTSGTPIKPLLGTIEETIVTLPDYDVFFTMAVLMHLHKDSDWVFAEIAKRARKFIICIEDEKSTGPRHHGREYKEIFEGLGFKQDSEEHRIPGLNSTYIGRVLINEN